MLKAVLGPFQTVLTLFHFPTHVQVNENKTPSSSFLHLGVSVSSFLPTVTLHQPHRAASVHRKIHLSVGMHRNG